MLKGATGCSLYPIRHSVSNLGLLLLTPFTANAQEPDSDDEWQCLLETTEPVPVQLKSPLTLLCNPDFCQRIQSQLRGTGEQVTS